VYWVRDRIGIKINMQPIFIPGLHMAISLRTRVLGLISSISVSETYNLRGLGYNLKRPA
jgi:hypothetical protein